MRDTRFFLSLRAHDVHHRYELPDGARIDVGIDRFKAAELILDPAPLLVASSAGELPAQGSPATASAVDPTTAAECDVEI